MKRIELFMFNRNAYNRYKLVNTPEVEFFQNKFYSFILCNFRCSFIFLIFDALSYSEIRRKKLQNFPFYVKVCKRD